MNTSIYKKVHLQAVELLKAAEAENDTKFMQLYEELKALCYEHEEDEAKNLGNVWKTSDVEMRMETDGKVGRYVCFNAVKRYGKCVKNTCYI